MVDAKKYITTVAILLGILLVGVCIVNILLLNVAYILEISVNTLVMIAILLILFSTIVTYRIIKNENINSTIMNINFKHRRL